MSTSESISRESSARTATQIGHMPYLDGMRGVAVLVVIVYHAMPNLVPGGFIGVDMFFALSGFLITLLLLKEYDRSGRINLKHFYIRRALRLLPALVLLLGVYLLVSLLLDWNIFERIEDAFLVICYTVNWSRAFDWRVPEHLGHTWSLSIEEQFYVIWPMLLLCLLRFTTCRRKLAWIIFCGAIAAWLLRLNLYLNGSTPERLYNGLDTRADSLLLGCVLGVLVSSDAMPRDREVINRLRLVACAAIVGLMLFLLNAKWWSTTTATVGMFIVPVLSLVIISSLLSSTDSLFRCVAEQRVLVWIGQLSYGLYLWHYFIFRVIRSTTSMTDLEVLLVGGAMSVAIASLSFYLIEQPFLRLKKQFA